MRRRGVQSWEALTYGDKYGEFTACVRVASLYLEVDTLVRHLVPAAVINKVRGVGHGMLIQTL